MGYNLFYSNRRFKKYLFIIIFFYFILLLLIYMKYWQPDLITKISLPNCKLTNFHIGSFKW